MRVLHLTNMWPSADRPSHGTFVKSMVEGLEKAGVESAVLAVNSDYSRLEYFRAIPRLHQLLHRDKFDLIHAQYAHCIIIAAMQRTVPVVAHFHGEFLDVDDPKDIVLAHLAARISTHCVAVDTTTFARLRRPHKALIPIGADPRLFTPMNRVQARKKLGIDLTMPIILFASDPQRPEKGYKLFRDVLTIVRGHLKGIEEVILHGYPHTQVPLLLNAADVMLLTSKVEASPTVVKEALLCNLPVVATNAGDTPLLLAGVRNCYSGSSEPKELAERVLTVLTLGNRSDGRKKESELSIDSTVTHMLKFYRDTLVASGKLLPGS